MNAKQTTYYVVNVEKVNITQVCESLDREGDYPKQKHINRDLQKKILVNRARRIGLSKVRKKSSEIAISLFQQNAKNLKHNSQKKLIR
jgi:hypothetical protein